MKMVESRHVSAVSLIRVMLQIICEISSKREKAVLGSTTLQKVQHYHIGGLTVLITGI